MANKPVFKPTVPKSTASERRKVRHSPAANGVPDPKVSAPWHSLPPWPGATLPMIKVVSRSRSVSCRSTKAVHATRWNPARYGPAGGTRKDGVHVAQRLDPIGGTHCASAKIFNARPGNGLPPVFKCTRIGGDLRRLDRVLGNSTPCCRLDLARRFKRAPGADKTRLHDKAVIGAEPPDLALRRGDFGAALKSSAGWPHLSGPDG
jgi:hypothetical protein